MAKRTSRNDVLASMDADNFRIDRIISTPAELKHANHRFDTLRWGMLERRIAVMTNPFKLIATIRAATKRGLKPLAMQARMKLNIVLDTRIAG